MKRLIVTFPVGKKSNNPKEAQTDHKEAKRPLTKCVFESMALSLRTLGVEAFYMFVPRGLLSHNLSMSETRSAHRHNILKT